MRCSVARRHLAAFLELELEPARAAAVRDHLSACAGCRAILQQYADNQRQLAQFLQHAPYLAVADRIRESTRPAPRDSRKLRLARGSQQLLAGAALVLLVALLTASVLAIRGAGQHGVRSMTGAAGNGAPTAPAIPNAAVIPATASPAATPLALATPAATPATPVTPATPAPVDQRLAALQATAGFQLFVPAWLPGDLTLADPEPPLRLPSFTTVKFAYQDSNANPAVSITEASPYQETRDTMPSDIYDASQPQDLGDGVTARFYDAGNVQLQLWWQRGPTSIRLETGALTKDQLLRIARSMAPIPAAPESNSLPPDAALRTAADAVARARTLVATLGGRPDATVSSTQLMTLAGPLALGLPAPAGVAPATPVWSVEFAGALLPASCPAAGSSVCSHGRLVVLLNALNGETLGWHGDDGAWQRPSAAGPPSSAPAASDTATAGVCASGKRCSGG